MMQNSFKSARIIMGAMVGSVLLMAVVALLLSERHGYGGSSEAKINFLRLALFVFSISQIVMAGAIRGAMQKMASGAGEGKRLAAQLVAGALCESVAIFGLVLTLISKAFMDYALFGVVSLIGLAVYFPRAKDWKDKEGANV